MTGWGILSIEENEVKFGKGGFQGSRGGPGSDWYIENTMAFLDAPGEWYLDADSRKLYFFANGTDAPSSSGFEAVYAQTLLNVNGSQAAPVRNLSLVNLGFRDAAPTYLEPHGVGVSRRLLQ